MMGEVPVWDLKNAADSIHCLKLRGNVAPSISRVRVVDTLPLCLVSVSADTECDT